MATEISTDRLQEESPFSLKGFGTLGAAHSSNGNAGFLRDVSQPKGINNNWSGRNDSIFGLQSGYKFNDVSEFVVQGVSHYRYDNSFSPELTWVFLKYDITPRLSLRAGRIGSEFLIQADSRMVGYSYLPVRSPVDFYGIVPFNYGDGIDIQARWPLGEGLLRSNFYWHIQREPAPL